MTWLSKADLQGANLRDANLQEAKFGESNLAQANLSGSRQHYGNFQDANMEGCVGCPTTWDK
ncbi:Pentapeptide repeats (8 copies) [compost metagenome]